MLLNKINVAEVGLRNDNNIEDEHEGFNHLVDVETIQHFLYRDYPDDI